MNNRKNYIPVFYTPCFLTVLTIALFLVPNNGILASCSWEISADHETIYSLEKSKPEFLAKPMITGGCAGEVKWHYQDQYQKIGCNVEGFQHYFRPVNWTVDKIYGDGGVDVTGAPNLKLVEGANDALVIAAPDAVTQVKLVIPADGYVAFDWRCFGGSNLFTVNDGQQELTASSNQSNYFSSLLHTGDVLTLQLAAAGSSESRVELSNFQFFSNALGVIKREWTATDALGKAGSFTQLITVEKTTLTNVILPRDFEGAAYSAAPSHTGYPVADTDGDPITISDQFPLLGRGDGFEVSWQDKWVKVGDHQILERTWTIKDKCSGSIMKDTQIINLKNLTELLESKKLNPTGLSKEVFSFQTRSGCGHYYELFSSGYGKSTLISEVAPSNSNLTDKATTNTLP